MMTESQNTLILVLGMHRSGTSAVSRALKALGVSLGNSLLEPGPDNVKGYWEDKDALQINEEIFDLMGSRWQSLSSTGYVDFRSRYFDVARENVGKFLSDRFANRTAFALKNPRMCLTWSLWREVCGPLSIDIKPIVVIRNPLDVALSLEKRNQIPIRNSLISWLAHIYGIATGMTDENSIVVAFERLVEKPKRELQRLACFLGRDMDRRQKEIDTYTAEYLEKDLIHHCSTLTDFKNVATDLQLPILWDIYNRLCAGSTKELLDQGFWSDLRSRLRGIETFPAILKSLSAKDIRSYQVARTVADAASGVRVYLDFGQGYSEYDSFSTYIHSDQSIQVDIHRIPGIKALRMDPIAQRCVLRINAVEARYLNGVSAPVTGLDHNASHQDGYILMFDHAHPSIWFTVNKAIQQVIFDIDFMAVGDGVGLFLTDYFKKEAKIKAARLRSAENALAASEEELASMAQSLSDKKAEIALHLKQAKISVAQYDTRVEAVERQKEKRVRRLVRRRSVKLRALAMKNKLLKKDIAEKEEAAREKTRVFNTIIKSKNAEIHGFIHQLNALRQRMETELNERDLKRNRILLHLNHTQKFYDAVFKSNRFGRWFKKFVDRKRRHQALVDRELILKTGLFDADYYLAANPDLKASNITPIDHYASRGALEGRDPCAQFDTAYYLGRYPDVAESGLNPLIHYGTIGKSQGRFISFTMEAIHLIDQSGMFDEDYYRDTYTDIDFSVANPLEHYLKHGAQEGRNPYTRFDTVYYSSRYSDVRESGLNPLLHYVLFGQKEERYTSRYQEDKEIINKSGYFDPKYYTETHKEVAAIGLDALDHYLRMGAAEGKKPTPDFDTHYYLTRYPDIAESGANPFAHYIKYGRAEQRFKSRIDEEAWIVRESGLFDESYYLMKNPDVAEAKMDPVWHFLEHGAREGRYPFPGFDPNAYLARREAARLSGENPLIHYIKHGRKIPETERATLKRITAKRPETILFVGHDCHAAGAQILLLDVMGWFRRHTHFTIKLILLEGGALINHYRALADDMYLLVPERMEHDRDTVISEIEAFTRTALSLVYLNTAASGKFLSLWQDDTIPTICHIHELKSVLAVFNAELEMIKARVKHFIAASKNVEENLIANENIPPERISTIPAFIALSETTGVGSRDRRRIKLGLTPEDIIVFGCGTLNWRKGPDMFVRVAAHVKRAGCENFHFYWIGGGEEAEKCRKIADRLGVADVVTFLGSKLNPRDFFSTGDIFLLPSREDPFPLVCLEAAEHELPVVCFEDAGGMPSFVRSDAGFCVPFADTKGMAQKTIQLMEDGLLRRKMGQRGRKRLLSNFTVETALPKILNLIRGVAAIPPAVSVLVPNYNHAAYLKQRLGSIYRQTFKDFEVLILDDASTDGSEQIIEAYAARPLTRVFSNQENSGSVFHQWCAGIEHAEAPLVWIAESDDFCDPNFLEVIVPKFSDRELNLCYAQSVVVDENGRKHPEALDPYLSRVSPNRWNADYTCSAFTEVNESLGVAATIVNASSVVFRKFPIENIKSKLLSFKMCGDWLFYLAAIKGGKVAYTQQTQNYFRRHQDTVVSKIEGSQTYFQEYSKITRYILDSYNVHTSTFLRHLKHVNDEWDRFSHRVQGPISNYYDIEKMQRLFHSRRVKPIRLALFINGMTFSKGGIERIGAQIANEMIQRGHSVTIIANDSVKRGPVYPLHPEVHLIHQFVDGSPETIANLSDVIVKERPDVFVAMLSEWIFEYAVAAGRKAKVPVIVSEHNDPEVIVSQWWSKEKREETFSKADGIHLLLDAFRKSLPLGFQRKITTIPNLVYPAKRYADPGSNNSRRKTVISVGRLAPQKQFHLLIEAFGALSSDFPSWDLKIFGGGHLRDILETEIETLGMKDRIFLKGIVDGIEREYQAAHLFVLPSAYEGFGIVTAEAHAHGLPAIGFADCPGVNEIIVDGKNGLLVPATVDRSAELEKSLRELMDDPEKRVRFGRHGIQTAKRYHPKKVFDQWEDFLLKATARERVS